MAYGSCEFLYSNQKLVLTGDVTIFTGLWDGEKSVIYEAMENSDLTVPQSIMVKGFSPYATFSFRDNANKSIVLPAGVGNCAIRTAEGNITHYFTGCVLVGIPSLNGNTGEISGLEVRLTEQGYYSRTGT